MPNKALDKQKSKEITEPVDKLKFLTIGDDPITIRKKVLKIIEGKKDGDRFQAKDSDDVIKGMSLNEFDNGVLLSTGTSDIAKTFAIDLMRKIQKEYNCATPTEKALAELAAASYVRILDLQRKLNSFVNKDSFGDITVKVISCLGKELDRANRHYLAAIQTLRMLRQPPIQLNINANTAVVGQNQIVQANNK